MFRMLNDRQSLLGGVASSSTSPTAPPPSHVIRPGTSGTLSLFRLVVVAPMFVCPARAMANCSPPHNHPSAQLMHINATRLPGFIGV